MVAKFRVGEEGCGMHLRDSEEEISLSEEPDPASLPGGNRGSFCYMLRIAQLVAQLGWVGRLGGEGDGIGRRRDGGI